MKISCEKHSRDTLYKQGLLTEGALTDRLYHKRGLLTEGATILF